jgi:hypothetical protein
MRYTAVDSSVYVSEDCYDSVSVIAVSDRRVIDTSGNQKRLVVAQTLSVLTVVGAYSNVCCCSLLRLCSSTYLYLYLSCCCFVLLCYFKDQYQLN